LEIIKKDKEEIEKERSRIEKWDKDEIGNLQNLYDKL